MDILQKLNRRYATKKFSDQKIKLSVLQTILEAANLTATSYGLQAYKILVIDDTEVRKQLMPFSMEQEQVMQASHLLVLCRYAKVSPEHVAEFGSRIGKAKSKTPIEIEAYSKKIIAKIEKKKAAGQFEAWLEKQVYIVLGNLMTTCAMLDVDSCPMEGFEPEAYDKLLGLEALNLKSVVLLPIGYRAEDDKYQFRKKVRKDLEDLLVFM